jgi:hypothetical protein
MSNKVREFPKVMLLAGLLASSICISCALTQAQGKDKIGESQPTPSTSVPSSALKVVPLSVLSEREAEYYRRRWGIDDIVVRETASGSLIRFSYRVIDADRAKILNDKKAIPYLIDKKDGLALQIPELEQVGQLRQVATPQNGREYWMAFSNKGRQVRAGSRVTVVIGTFRAEELVVTGQSTFPSAQIHQE